MPSANSILPLWMISLMLQNLLYFDSYAFLELLKTMAHKPQEYITPTGKVTTNSEEGFHGLTLKCCGKRIDLGLTHFST